MNVAPWVKYCVCLALFAPLGCGGDEKFYPIHGVVSTKPGISEPYILPSDHEHLDFRPVPGAKVVLAFDKEGKDLVPGFCAVSDEQGKYELLGTTIPRPKDRYDNYFLIVEKSSFEPFSTSIRIGPWAHHLRNRVVLKSQTETEANPENRRRPK